MSKLLLSLVCAAGVAVAGLYIYKGVACNVAHDDGLPSTCCSSSTVMEVSTSGCCATPGRAELIAAKPSCCAEATTAVAVKEGCCASGACCKSSPEVLVVAPREVK